MLENHTFQTVFQSVEYVKSYLRKCYEENGFSAYNELAFQNSYTFLYYIKMGESFFQQGKESPLSIKPVLLFYGLTHWLKAALLTNDPDYPSTTQVLAHGISTRKKKKQGYRFLSDEIKVQKNGFFPYFSQTCFSLRQLTGEKYKMRHLLMSIPELLPLFETLEKEKPLLPVKRKGKTIEVSSILLKRLNMSQKYYEIMVLEKNCAKVSCTKLDEDTLSLKLDSNAGEHLPIFSTLNQSHYLPAIIPLYWRTPEILTHFLLLYNLSMICRYETEWWGELLFTFSSNDRPFIEGFLNCTEEKTPYLLQSLFFQNKTI